MVSQMVLTGICVIRLRSASAASFRYTNQQIDHSVSDKLIADVYPGAPRIVTLRICVGRPNSLWGKRCA